MAAEQLWSTFHSPMLIHICNESNDEKILLYLCKRRSLAYSPYFAHHLPKHFFLNYSVNTHFYYQTPLPLNTINFLYSLLEQLRPALPELETVAPICLPNLAILPSTSYPNHVFQKQHWYAAPFPNKRLIAKLHLRFLYQVRESRED